MSFICFYKKFVFVTLFFSASAFGMRDLAKLSLEEAADLWRGGVLTSIHKIEIKHNHKLEKIVYEEKSAIEFDKTGDYVRLNYIDSDKQLKYHICYDIRKQEEIDMKTIQFVLCDKRWVNHAIDHNDEEFRFSEPNFNSIIVFGRFDKPMYKDENDLFCTDIGVYDFLYEKLLFRLPINRTQDRNLAVNHNNSMIATNLDDGKETIVILYPQLLNFLKYKNYYDFKIGYN